MPIYEYICAGCDVSFEKLVRSETKVECPLCKSARVERLISAPARPNGGAAAPPDYSSLGPPQLKRNPGGGCGGGGCGCH
jgi:putative FmdB family regulatory protein